MRIEVRNAFRKSFKIFVYLTILSFLAYLVLVFIDDYVLIEKYGLSWMGIGIWILYYLAYYLPFSIFYWLATTAIILIFSKKE